MTTKDSDSVCMNYHQVVGKVHTFPVAQFSLESRVQGVADVQTEEEETPYVPVVERTERPTGTVPGFVGVFMSQGMGCYMIFCSTLWYCTFLDVGCLEASLLKPVSHLKLSFDTKTLCFLMGRCSPARLCIDN